MNNKLKQLLNFVLYVSKILTLIIVADIILYLLFPLGSILVGLGDGHCNNIILGCHPVDAQYSYVAIPSFLVASHEYAHIYGAGEVVACMMTIMMVCVYALFSIVTVETTDRIARRLHIRTTLR